jgi:membrane protein implicated in regulation of membrane protease activity
VDLRGAGVRASRVREFVSRELSGQVEPGHPLYGKTWNVLARSLDYLLVEIDGSSWMVVREPGGHGLDRPLGTRVMAEFSSWPVLIESLQRSLDGRQ